MELGGILVKFGKLFDGIVGIWWSLQRIMSDLMVLGNKKNIVSCGKI